MRYRFPPRLLLKVILLSLAALVLAGRAAQGPSAPSSRIVWALAAAPAATHPGQALDAPSRRVLSNVFEGLVRIKPGSGGEIEPALARTWDVSADGLTWTFELRPGIRFHDGSPCDAAAVVRAVEAQRKGSSPYAEFIYAPVDTVEAMDERTVRFHLRYPYAPFIRNLAMLQASVTGTTGTHGIPAGTGPYRVTVWNSAAITLAATPGYWGPPPQTREIRFVVIAQRDRRLTELAAGRIDAADEPGLVTAPPNAPYGVLAAPGQNLGYLGFYTNKEPFDNPALRRAVAQALDVPALIRDTFPDGRVIPATGFLPPGLLGYDPEAAAQSLTPSPVLSVAKNSGVSFTLITYRDVRPYAPTGGTVLARMIAERLAAAGIRVQVRSYPWDEFKQALRRQEGDAFIYGWVGDNGDPDNFLHNLLATSQIPCGQNIARYSNPQVDLLLGQAQQERDEKQRAALYREAQQIILADLPWIPLTQGVEAVALRRDLSGLPSPAPETPLHGVYHQAHR